MPAPTPGAAGCGLSSAAFCDTFDQGPASVRGRGGDLDATKWTAGRLAPSDMSGGGGAVANPVMTAPIPSCKASFPMSSVFPPFDTMICDPDSRGNRRLMTAVSAQNYGVNSYMIQQPFDFAGRTGKIAFDVEPMTDGILGAFINLDLTEDPLPVPQFQEYENFEVGPVPRNGLMLKWVDQCGTPQQAVRLSNTMVYNNYVMTILNPTFNVDFASCPKTRRGFLNHFEVRISQTRLEVYGSDYSPDGVAIPNLRLIYSANISLPFTRGYVHVAARNHASIKYGLGPVGVFRWDNIGFDGPIISGHKMYDVPDNTKMGTFYDGKSVMNLGYVLRDGTNGIPAGMYDPTTRVATLQIPNVNLSGSTRAKLSLNAFFNSLLSPATENFGLQFRLNGGTWRNRNLTAREVQIMNNQVNPTAVGAAGNILLLIDVPFGDVRNGTNTIEFLPLNSPMNYPPVIANISLMLTP